MNSFALQLILAGLCGPFPRPASYTVEPKPSGVKVPDHSTQRIAAAQAKRERKAARRQCSPTTPPPAP